jgi:hypothetical protein
LRSLKGSRPSADSLRRPHTNAARNPGGRMLKALVSVVEDERLIGAGHAIPTILVTAYPKTMSESGLSRS